MDSDPVRSARTTRCQKDQRRTEPRCGRSSHRPCDHPELPSPSGGLQGRRPTHVWRSSRSGGIQASSASPDHCDDPATKVFTSVRNDKRPMAHGWLGMVVVPMLNQPGHAVGDVGVGGVSDVLVALNQGETLFAAIRLGDEEGGSEGAQRSVVVGPGRGCRGSSCRSTLGCSPGDRIGWAMKSGGSTCASSLSAPCTWSAAAQYTGPSNSRPHTTANDLGTVLPGVWSLARQRDHTLG